MIKYYKLFDMLNRRDMKKSDLKKIISGPTITKLAKGEIVRTDIIEKLCDFLDCQPGDIMENVREYKDNTNNEIVEIAVHKDPFEGWPDGARPEPDDINIYRKNENGNPIRRRSD